MSVDKGNKRETAEGGFRPVHLFVILTMIAAAGAVVTVGGSTPARTVFVSLAVGSVGIASYALYRAVWPLVALAGDGESETAEGGIRVAPSGDEVTALRAMKDLEFDRAMGKVSEADFQDMRARLVAGRSGYRDVIERDLAARLALTSAQTRAAHLTAGGEAGSIGRPRPRVCGNCATPNDPDAEFCKKCGSRLNE